MGRYFAKLFPVEEKIKEGDKALKEDGTVVLYVNQSAAKHLAANWKKLILFLCDNTIDIDDHVKTTKDEINYFDDKVTEVTDTGFFTDARDFSSTGIFYKRDQCFKVVGEISPFATWIGDGDNIGEDGWRDCWWLPSKGRFIDYGKDNLADHYNAGDALLKVQILNLHKVYC